MAKPKAKAAPKKAKRTRSPSYGGKAALIMSFSESTPSAQIVAAGAAKGLKFSQSYVSTIRRLARARNAKGAPARKGRPPSTPKASAKPGRKPAAAKVTGRDQAFIDLVLQLGMAKVDELLARVKAFRI